MQILIELDEQTAKQDVGLIDPEGYNDFLDQVFGQDDASEAID